MPSYVIEHFLQPSPASTIDEDMILLDKPFEMLVKSKYCLDVLVPAASTFTQDESLAFT